ncbi:hypothetical protein GCM10010872_02950 [Dyella flava]|nr:hypothetical protein GCM10010872_02950 [Dyella flava]
MNSFSMIFEDRGSYPARCKVTFDSASEPSKSPMNCQLTGGQVKPLEGIPSDALNLIVEIQLILGPLYRYEYATPSTELPRGKAKFDIYGLWPGPSRVEVTG